MTVNLGRLDAVSRGLDFENCQAGMEVNADEDACLWLVEHGHAVTVKGVSKAAAVQGVPPETPKPKAKAKDGKVSG